ncbi:VWA domain-containing protein [Candidatus Nanohaloarchaea archaeon]|nr:VWA domain-containing protein [Candidatus Nanohaloarchaea archaeon]
MLSALSNSALSNYFLDPTWSLALAALVPLIIFYLVRPKPDEKMMPSIRFFMKDRKDGKVQQALSAVLRNLMLIFHILFVAAIAAAAANPFINAPATADSAVIVIDNSASMQGNLEEAKQFAIDHLGKENTVILVNDDVEVLLQQGSTSAAKNAIKSVEQEQTGTDMIQGLRTAQTFTGQLVLATDTDHTLSSSETNSLIQSMSANRDIEAMDLASSNSWGIVDLSPKKGWIEVKNYRETTQEIQVTLDETSETVKLQSGEARRVNLELEKGKNTVKLPTDGMKADNKAFIYLPEDYSLQTALISDEKNNYLFTALDIINSTDPEYYSPHLDTVPNSDVYVIGGFDQDTSDNPLSTSINKIEQNVQDGATAVVFASPGLQPQYFESLPVKDIGERKSMDVEFNKPRKINIGSTQVYNATATGNSLSDPSEALVHTKYGQGDVIFYNIRDEDFRTNFLYPIFWKDLVKKYTEVKTAEDLNVQTGSTELVSGQLVEFNQTGFYDRNGKTYAANLLNEDESSPEQKESISESSGTATVPKSVQNLSALAVLLLALIETGYLYYIGDIE